MILYFAIMMSGFLSILIPIFHRPALMMESPFLVVFALVSWILLGTSIPILVTFNGIGIAKYVVPVLAASALLGLVFSNSLMVVAGLAVAGLIIYCFRIFGSTRNPFNDMKFRRQQRFHDFFTRYCESYLAVVKSRKAVLAKNKETA